MKIKKRQLKLNIQSKLILIYIVGGLCPIILVVSILLDGYGSNLIKLAKESEKTALSFVENNLIEEYNIVLKVSDEFFFNETLEKIASTDYKSVIEMRNDYRKLTDREDYLMAYWKTIHRIYFHIDNESILGNAVYCKVDETIRNEEWYQETLNAAGRAIWRYEYNEYARENFLILSRLIRTMNRTPVGVINIGIRNSDFQTAMGNRDILTCLVLNDSILIAANAEAIEEEILGLCQEYTGREGSFRVEYNGEEYMLTLSQITFDAIENQTTLLSLRSYKDILVETYRQSGEIVLYVVISVICAMTMISIFSIHFGKRIENFRSAMAKAAVGDFVIAERVSGTDEIAELYDNLYVMIESIEHLLNVVYQEQILKEQLHSRQKEVEFKMLASQINPHFLYNTLENIRMKARAAGNAEVEDIVKMLSKILRRNIEATDKQVPLKSELQLIEYYLKIQKYRFEDRIRFDIDVRCDIGDYKILPLLIQPLVENAFVHGLEGRKSGGEIKVWIECSDKMRIHVKDNGMGMTAEMLATIRGSLEERQTLDSRHIGISNVNQRIKLMYGDNYGLVINSEQGVGTEVIIEIPVDSVGESER